MRGYRSVLARARRKLDEVHETAPIDYVKHTGLFTIDSSDRFTRMKAKLLVAGSDVRGKAGLAAVTENLVIEGNNIQLDGISNGLKAVDETLTCGLKVTGLCKIEGANIRVRGVHFVTPAGSGADRVIPVLQSASPTPRATSCSTLRRQAQTRCGGTVARTWCQATSRSGTASSRATTAGCLPTSVVPDADDPVERDD